MVYCGKASLGCLSCRKRRIKCDRRQPECTQCVRLSKACPGYRDQLSLMFRDETVKVEKRVRASWGMDDSSSQASSSSDAYKSAPARAKKATSSSTLSRRSETAPEPASMPKQSASPESTSPKSSKSSHISPKSEGGSPIPVHAGAVQRATADRFGAISIPWGPYPNIATAPSTVGVSFYVQHYLLGYPDEVRNPAELSSLGWFEHPSAQATMAALGLAALANVNDDKQLQHLSKVKYGEALKSTNQMLRDPVNNLEAAIRTTVMLALFQCIHMSHESHENAKVHVMGCMAVIKTAIPIRSVPANGTRGVLQLCYSLLYHCIQSGHSMPDELFDSIREGIRAGFLPEYDQPGASLIYILARFTRLNATVRRTAYSDGHEATADAIRELLAVDEALGSWEASQHGKWTYQTHTDKALPPSAAFRNTYHRYSDVWTSRVWNHYRWGRILTNQMLLELLERYPLSAAGLVPPGQRDRSHETIRRLAVDVLTSVPTHYRHPSLTWAHLDAIQTHGGAGAGAVGIPHLMFHLQVAACAPGVPHEVWRWAVDVMDTAWCELGMLHAKSLADMSRNHRAKLDRASSAEVVLKTEPGLEDEYYGCGVVVGGSPPNLGGSSELVERLGRSAIP